MITNTSHNKALVVIFDDKMSLCKPTSAVGKQQSTKPQGAEPWSPVHLGSAMIGFSVYFLIFCFFIAVMHRTEPMVTVLLLQGEYAKPKVVFSTGGTSRLKQTLLYWFLSLFP